MEIPGAIRKLDDDVVNRIAAGEIIQRPANALKEMLENSLDAKATSIQVSVKNGGMKLLQVQDNGTGIRKEDLGIVCERFTTSKLQKFEDLRTISTYGFRGEALASISFVAHLTITTKTVDGKCAYKVSYSNGRPKDAPKPCAGNQGTQINVEDLFYNVAVRRKALKSAAEEYSKISEVVGRYAIHNPKVSFTLKKHGEATSDIKTPPNSTTIENIRLIFGNEVAKSLIEIETEDEVHKFKLHAFVSNNAVTNKKLIFLLFINHRLVDSSGLKKSLEQMYSSYMPKQAHPFLYISLEMDPHNVDVNVHPTKSEVHFLHEDSIINKVKTAIEQKILNCDKTRTYYMQSMLPGVQLNAEPKEIDSSPANKTYAHQMVRTDSASQKLDKFFGSPTVIKSAQNATNSPNTKDITSQSLSRNTSISQISKSNCQLTSVLELRQAVEDNMHLGLKDLLLNSSFIGCVSPLLSLVQYNTGMYLINIYKLCEELFYQLMMYNFGSFGIIKLSDALPIEELVKIALDDTSNGWTESDGPKEDLAKKVQGLLVEKRDMLYEYFSLRIDSDGSLRSLPLLLDKYNPDVRGLPRYMLRLATEVDWGDEKKCFEGFCRETARFFSEWLQEEKAECVEDKEWQWIIEHVLHPALRQSLLPPKTFIDDATVLQIASIPDLYRVFERC